jgi:hypothetical protein
VTADERGTAKVARVLILVCDSFGVGGAPDAGPRRGVGHAGLTGGSGPQRADLGLGAASSRAWSPSRAEQPRATDRRSAAGTPRPATGGGRMSSTIVPASRRPAESSGVRRAIRRRCSATSPPQAEIVPSWEFTCAGRPSLYTSGDNLQVACHVDVAHSPSGAGPRGRSWSASTTSAA